MANDASGEGKPPVRFLNPTPDSTVMHRMVITLSDSDFGAGSSNSVLTQKLWRGASFLF